LKVIIDLDVNTEIDMLKSDEIEQAVRILQRIKELGLEYHSFPFNCKRVQEFKKEDRAIYRFYTPEFDEYRIFYLVDHKHNCIYVMQMIEKKDSTYDPDSYHFRKMKEQYDDYFRRKLWREGT